MKTIQLLFVIAILSIVTSTAQTKSDTKIQKEISIQATIDTLLQAGIYQFIPDRAMPTVGPKSVVDIAGSYYFKVTPSEIDSYLPFFGTSTSPQIGHSDSPMAFTTQKLTTTTQSQSKVTTVNLEADIQGQTANITIEISRNGQGVLTINHPRYSQISYYGSLTPIKE